MPLFNCPTGNVLPLLPLAFPALTLALPLALLPSLPLPFLIIISDVFLTQIEL